MPVCLTKRKALVATRPCFSSGEKRFFFTMINNQS